MSQPPHDEARRAARPTADPTIKVPRPPVPGRAGRTDVSSGSPARPPNHHDETTVTLTPRVGGTPQRTLQFGAPAPVKVTVGPRARPRRRYRTWPWIVAVVLALAVLGTVLLVMMLRGATIDADTDLVGSPRAWPPAVAAASGG